MGVRQNDLMWFSFALISFVLVLWAFKRIYEGFAMRKFEVKIIIIFAFVIIIIEKDLYAVLLFYLLPNSIKVLLIDLKIEIIKKNVAFLLA